MKKMVRLSWLFMLCWVCGTSVHAQQGQMAQKQGRDTVPSRSRGIPTIAKFVADSAEKHTGMFNVYVQDGRYLVEIPNALMGRDLVAVVALVKGSAQLERTNTQMYGFAGDGMGHRLLRFEMGTNDQVLLLEPNYSDIIRDTTNEKYEQVKKLGARAVSMYFDVKAKGEESVLIDMTDALMADNFIFSLKNSKNQLGLGAFQPDKSYLSGVSCYGDNVIFRSVKSYATGTAPTVMFDKGPAKDVKLNPTMWEVGVSLCLLPEKPMRPRYEDSRVGYFVEKCDDLIATPYGSNKVSFAARWRLEPKPEDMERYKRGELVEPVKPIVFYVDYNVPEYMMQPLIDGINDWQKAFERAGFKNAIVGKRMPTPSEDPDFSPEDARYSTISYKAAPIANAYGPHMSDPRTGEILCAKIALFHNVQELVQKWYFTQVANIDPRVRQFPLPEDLMGKIVRYIVSHEVGHSLGLRHNFISSWTYSIDQIRDKEYVKKYGHVASIMDYARFNYVAQPEDQIDVEDLIPRINEYDEFAIEWGYRYFPKLKNEEAERVYLEDWTTKQQKENPRRLFGVEYNPMDPRLQMEDLGDNSMEAGELGLKNLKSVLNHLEEWTKGDDERYTILKSMYQGVRYQYLMYMTHVVNNVGGSFSYDKLLSEGPGLEKAVSREQQKEAMAFLDRHLFTTPDWMFDEQLMPLVGLNKESMMKSYYVRFMDMLLKKSLGIRNNEKQLGGKAYTVQEFVGDLHKGIFTELSSGEAVSPVRRDLQRLYIRQVKQLVDQDYVDEPEVSSVFLVQMDQLREEAKRAAKGSPDYITKAYWEDIARGLDKWLGVGADIAW